MDKNLAKNERGGLGKANAIDSTQEEAFWRKNHPNQSFVKKHYSYDHYAPAYRVGYEGFTKYEGQDYDNIEDDLAKDYENHRIGSALPWDEARHATRAAWERLSGTVSPRDPTRGMRSGI